VRDTATDENQRFLLWLCLAIGAAFFVLNHAGVVGGWLHAPPGYEPLFDTRAPDIAQYLTWAKAFETRWLAPDFHAPWMTEAALFNPVFSLLARTSRLTGDSFLVLYKSAHFLAFLLCGYGLFRCLTVFTTDRRETVSALVWMTCSVPLDSLLALASPFGAGRVFGMRNFLFVGFNGFSHAMPGGLPVTIGVALTLLSFAYVGAYLRSRRRSHLFAAAATVFVSSLVHPFEPFVVLVAAGGALVISGMFVEAIVLGVAGLAGFLPYIAAAARTEWIRAAAGLNIYHPGNPIVLVAALGLPTVIGLSLLVSQRRLESGTDLLLQLWVVSVLVLLYVPVFPWAQHFFDGYHCAIGMLVARQLPRDRVAAWITRVVPGFALRGAAACLLFLSLAAYPVYWYAAFLDGPRPQPRHYFNTMIRSDEKAVIEWLRQNAGPDDLVLAPPDLAPWVATVPMHSFGSHWVFSLSFEDQRAFARALFADQLPADTAARVLADYGVRYLIVPEGSPLNVGRYAKRATIGMWGVFEDASARMKRYPGRAATRLVVH